MILIALLVAGFFLWLARWLWVDGDSEFAWSAGVLAVLVLAWVLAH